MITTIFFWGLLESPKHLLHFAVNEEEDLRSLDFLNRLIYQVFPTRGPNAGG